MQSYIIFDTLKRRPVLEALSGDVIRHHYARHMLTCIVVPAGLLIEWYSCHLLPLEMLLAAQVDPKAIPAYPEQ